MKNFTKITKIILFNVIIVFLILVCADYHQYKVLYNKIIAKSPQKLIAANNIPTYRENFFQGYSPHSIQGLKYYYKDGDWKYFRKTFMEDSKKPSIILFGGSFTYGSFLNDDETFSYKLSERTGRAVYNRGIEAGSPAHMLYMLRDENFYKHIKQPPDYIIYTYITNHQDRINNNMYPSALFISGYNFQYKLKDGKLVIKQDLPAFIYKSFLIKNIYAHFDKINRKKLELKFNLINAIFLESKKLIEQHYPNAKFVVIDYGFEYNIVKNDFPQLWDTLEKEGFIVLHTKDLVGRDFSSEETAKDGFHPSGKVWDLLVPELVKKLNL